MILGASFLTAKYTGENQLQKRSFFRESQNIFERTQNIESLGELFPWFRDIENFWKFERFRNGKAEEKRISFFLYNTDSQALIFRHLIEYPDFEIAADINPGIYTKNEKYIFIAQRENHKFVSYATISYPWDEYLHDILYLLALASIFSGLLYFIGSILVWRALEPVEQNLDDMQNFIHDAGHELKTPLAVMRGNMQIMQAEENFDRDLLKQNVKNIDVMTKLIEWLRELAETGKSREKSSLALSAEVHKIIEQYRDFAKERKIKIDTDVKWALIIRANETELEMLIGNILKNAIIYSSKWSSVHLSLKKNILSITDTGKGISSEDQKKIFERFYRAQSVRSKDGYGIGLSLVDKIAKANNWKIQLQSEEWKGSMFKIIF